MRKIRYVLLWFSILWLGMYKPVYAQEEEALIFDLPDVWGEYGLGEVTEKIRQLFPEYQFDGQKILTSIFKGEILEAVGVIWDGIKGSLSAEVTGMKNLMVSILLLGILSALFANFSDMFKNQQIADISFYFLYLLLMAVLMQAFLQAAEITAQTVENIVLFVRLFIPTYFVAVGAASGTATAAAYYQFMLILAYIVEKVLLTLILPLIYSYVLMALMNGVWAEERLTLLLELLKKGIEIGLKAAMAVVTSLSLIQAMITPVLDSLRTSAVKKAIGAIPGIGDLAEGMTEMVIGSAVLIKNSIGIFLLFLLFAVCFIPLFKLLLIACMMKGCAALVGIVSDKRITGCTDRVGDGSLLLFRTAFTSVSLFFITIAVVSYITGMGGV